MNENQMMNLQLLNRPWKFVKTTMRPNISIYLNLVYFWTPLHTIQKYNNRSPNMVLINQYPIQLGNWVFFP